MLVLYFQELKCPDPEKTSPEKFLKREVHSSSSFSPSASNLAVPRSESKDERSRSIRALSSFAVGDTNKKSTLFTVFSCPVGVFVDDEDEA